jgi:hypothetical protein
MSLQMTTRDRIIAALVIAGVHLLALGPLIGDASNILDNVFHSQAEAILDGALPYADRGFEYPPLALPLVLAPGLVSDAEASYRAAFGWEMLGFDLSIVLMLALAVRGDRRFVWGALGVYTVGVVGLSGLGPLPDSDIELQPLALARFDLAPAALVLAASLARERGRSATWSALLSTATAVKGYALILYPSFLRDEPDPRRVFLAALPPLLIAAGIVLVTGDEFGSAITYHTGRQLQIETLAATPFMLAHSVFGAGASTDIGAGAYNLVARGADLARALTIAFLVAGYLLLAREGWRRRTPPLQIATAILALAVAFSPVLSPQFLLWVLPVSAAAFGLRLPNLLLVATVLLTEVMLSQYSGVTGLSNSFVLAIAARNAFLLAYVAAAVVYALRTPGPGTVELRPA